MTQTDQADGPMKPIRWGSTFEERVRKVRDLLDMDQQEFGALFGVGYKAVSVWETGKGYPRDVIAFANYLAGLLRSKGWDITPEWILTGQDAHYGHSDVMDLRVLDGQGHRTAPTLPFLVSAT